MPDIFDLRRARQEREKRYYEPSHHDIPATITSVDGFTQPPNQPDYVYVSVFNQPESVWRVYNNKVQVLVGAHVWIGPMTRPPYSMEIKGVYGGGLTPQGDHNLHLLSVSPHGQVHQQPTEANVGTDPVDTFQPALEPLKTTGDGSTLTVTTQSHIYVVNGVRRSFAGTTIDLTSSVPGSGLMRNVLVYLDEDTNSLLTLEGTTVPTSGGIPAPKPDEPANGRASAYVELTNGQTAITTATHIEDARDYLKGNRKELPTATAEGRILIVDDALQWVAGLPMIDENGNIMTDENAQIMWEG